MEKRNKRGETSPMGTIMAVIIVVVVGALVIWGFYKYFKPISDLPELALSEKQTLTGICDAAGKVGDVLKTTYCYQVNYKAGDRYGNCEYWKNYVDFQGLTDTCDSDKVKSAALEFCNTEKLTIQKVNNKACTDWIKEAAASSGTTGKTPLQLCDAFDSDDEDGRLMVLSGGECPANVDTGQKDGVKKNDIVASDGKVCCVYPKTTSNIA